MSKKSKIRFQLKYFTKQMENLKFITDYPKKYGKWLTDAYTRPLRHTLDIHQTLKAPLSQSNIKENVFKFLSTRDKCRVAGTCRAFNRFACSRTLWRKVDICHLTSFPPGALRWLLRRAPESLVLPPCVNYRSLVWLLSRSPTLRKLKIQGASWSAVAAINTQQAFYFNSSYESYNMTHII